MNQMPAYPTETIPFDAAPSETMNGTPETIDDNSDYDERYLGLNSLQRYLEEMGRYPLLDEKQEVDLAQKIEAGVLAEARLSDTTLMMHDHYKKDLATLAEIGKQAKNEMIVSNLRLVVRVAAPYQTRYAPLLDLIQEGNAGLMRAVEMFDHAKGYKFSTYATNWIRTYVLTYRNEQMMPIHLSVTKYAERRKVTKFIEEYRQDRDTVPPVDAIAAGTGLKAARVAEAQEYLGYQFPSLNFQIDDNGGKGEEFGSLLRDEHEASVVDMALGVTYAMDGVMHRTFVSEADKECAAMLILHVGLPFDPTFISPELAQKYTLKEGCPYQLKEIAEIFGMSRDAARLRLNKALKKLREPEVKQELLESIG
jgi:RNA polymerase primary sigma factor